MRAQLQPVAPCGHLSAEAASQHIRPCRPRDVEALKRVCRAVIHAVFLAEINVVLRAAPRVSEIVLDIFAHGRSDGPAAGCSGPITTGSYDHTVLPRHARATQALYVLLRETARAVTSVAQGAKIHTQLLREKHVPVSGLMTHTVAVL